jgi:hypothetical protein
MATRSGSPKPRRSSPRRELPVEPFSAIYAALRQQTFDPNEQMVLDTSALTVA